MKITKLYHVWWIESISVSQVLKTMIVTALTLAIAGCSVFRIPYYPSSLKGTPDEELSILRPIGYKWSIDRGGKHGSGGNLSGLEIEIYVSPGPHMVEYHTVFRKLELLPDACKTKDGEQIKISKTPPMGLILVCNGNHGPLEVMYSGGGTYTGKANWTDTVVSVRLNTEAGKMYIITEDGEIKEGPNPYLK